MKLSSILQEKFGAITVKPIYSYQGQEAKRVLVAAKYGSKASSKILSGLVMHQKDGSLYQSRNTHFESRKMIRKLYIAVMMLTVLLMAQTTSAKPNYQIFMQSDNSNEAVIDYGDYQKFLDDNLQNLPSGIAGFDYKNISEADKALLKQQLAKMQNTTITDYNDDEQMAFWLNLYNVIVLDMILDFYPINSFLDIETKIKGSLWKFERVTIMGQEMALDNIQHDVLREKYDDWRIINGLNVAALSSGPWQAKPFMGENIEAQLEAHTADLFLYPLTASVTPDNHLRLIAGLKWYEEDFAKTETNLDEVLQQYLPNKMKSQLAKITDIEYFYDWRLNQP